jgi:DNA repair protein RecO (recombination protein O)
MPLPERVYRTEAIVLRRHDLGEADRILTLYTRDYGKVRAIAKGVRKLTSRKAGHVELFMRVDVLIAQGRDLDIVTQAQMVEAYPSLRDDLLHVSHALHFVELLDSFTEERDANRSLYTLVADGLTWLTTTGDLRRAARYYELRILDLAGYRPQLFQCVVCGEAITAKEQFYSHADGGVVCPRCGQTTPHAKPISLNALKVLRYMQTQPFTAVEQVKLSQRVQGELEHILHDTLTYHLERRLKSSDFLNRLRRETRSGKGSGRDIP